MSQFTLQKSETEPKKIVSVGLTQEELDKLKGLAEPNKVSLAEAVRQMVVYCLNGTH